MKQEVNYGFPEGFFYGAGQPLPIRSKEPIKKMEKECPHRIMQPIKIPMQQEK